jgi:hypothetical protein
MALEYRQLSSIPQSILSEPDLIPTSSPYHKRKRMNVVDILEEEIYILRTLMEKTAEDEQSFTSEMVVQISSLLDKKINEYMKLERNLKKRYPRTIKDS